SAYIVVRPLFPGLNTMTGSGFFRKTRNFMRWTGFEKACFPVAWLLLRVSRLIILVIPFRYFAPYLGAQLGVSPWIPLLCPKSEARAASVGKAVRGAAAHTPWNSNCFAQAVTARILLGFSGIP